MSKKVSLKRKHEIASVDVGTLIYCPNLSLNKYLKGIIQFFQLQPPSISQDYKPIDLLVVLDMVTFREYVFSYNIDMFFVYIYFNLHCNCIYHYFNVQTSGKVDYK